MRIAIISILKALLATIIIFISINAFFHIYLYIQNRIFDKTQIGMKMEKVREIMGKPDEIKRFHEEIMEVYYYFPAAESRFFFSKKDSILTRNWRTDFD